MNEALPKLPSGKVLKRDIRVEYKELCSKGSS
jgi:hypothetical protein